MIFHYEIVAIYLIVTLAKQNLLMEYFNSLTFDSQEWKCLATNSNCSIYQCGYGTSLVQLGFECNQIGNTFQNIPPHYSIQLYVDLIAYSSVDPGEVTYIYADSNLIYTYSMLYGGDAYNGNQCGSVMPAFYMNTIIIDTVHSNAQLMVKFSTNIDELFDNEGYLFRNLQIFYKSCHYTCKTCSNEAYNSCLSCFTQNPVPISNECQSCKNQQNQRFLLNTQGCLIECPSGYNYDEEFVCNANIKLIYLQNLNQIQPMVTQDFLLTSNLNLPSRTPLQCTSLVQYIPYYLDEILYYSLNLQSTSKSIRLRATLILIGSWTANNQLQIKLDEQLQDTIIMDNLVISTMNSVILFQNSVSCSSKNLIRIRIELHLSVDKTNVQLSFNGLNLINQSWSIYNVKLEQELCSLNCNQCVDRYNCKTCNLPYYLHKGQCIEKCPQFSSLVGQTCLDLDEELIDQQNSKIIYLLKEFYDVSTTKERVLELFQLISYSTNNFRKGNDIYFSYIPDKKVFGGALVWVDATFKLQLKIPKYHYQLRIKFKVILGDDFDPGNFQYQINNKNSVTLNRYSPNPISTSQIWGNNFIDYVYQVDETVREDDTQNTQLAIIFKCTNPTKQTNQAFCAIEDLFITAEFYCSKQYRFDIFNYEKGMNQCVSICGDGYVVDEEQCDDGNLDPFDGCFNCHYQCEEFCQNCIQGICFLTLDEDEIQILKGNQKRNQEFSINYQVLESYVYDCQIECLICKNRNCYQCMDGYLIDIITQSCFLLVTGCNNLPQYSKTIQNYSKTTICKSDLSSDQQLDNMNQDPYYQCINCLNFEFQSCNNKCSFCYQGQCWRCNAGYTLDSYFDCVSICGDGLINQEIINNNEVEEQCDNPLDDGCQNCKIQSGYKCLQLDNSICWTCGQNCLKCNNQNDILICVQCVEGYYEVESFCQKCDDNCITCKIDQALCTSCYRDDCEKCENIPGLYTDYQIKSCVPLCGDGIKIQYYEQCDDGNIEDGDGCDSNCNIEQQETTYSISIERLNGQTSNDLNIIYDSTIDLICQNTNVTIDGFDQLEFLYNSTSVDDGCQIQFQFFKSIYKTNIIHIYIQFQEIITRLLNEQQYKEIQVSPVEQIFIDDSQQSQADAITDAQQSFSLLIWILVPLSVLFGLFDYLWAVLEILSWINNFYFFNVNFPFNVQILFLNSDWSSFVSFPTYNELNQPGCDYYFESPPRFTEKGVDPLFINNAQVPFCFILTSIIFYILSMFILFMFKFIDQALRKRQPLHMHSTYSIEKSTDIHLHKQNRFKKQDIYFKSNKYSQYIVQKLIIISNSFQMRIKQTITLCLLDLTMAIILQLIFGTEFQHKMILLNNILAFLFCLLIIYQLRQSYFVIGIHKSIAECPHFKQKYGCYYENINVENSFGLKFNYFGLIRKISYTFCIVYFYYNPLLQTSFCFISCSSGVFLLLYSNPFESKGQYYKQLISESGLSLIIFVTLLLSIDDLLNKLEEQTKINLGWVIISLVIICVSCEIITLIFEICLLFYEAVVQTVKYLFNKNKIDQTVKNKNQTQQENLPQTTNPKRLTFRLHGQLHQITK